MEEIWRREDTALGRIFGERCRTEGVGPLSSLSSLSLGGRVWDGWTKLSPSVTDDGMRALSPLTTCTCLDLTGCKAVSAEGMKATAPLVPLTSLNLSGCRKVRDEGANTLAMLTALTSLDLSITNIGVRTLALLRALIQPPPSWCGWPTSTWWKCCGPGWAWSASRGSPMCTPRRGMCPLSPRPWQVQMAVVKASWSLGCPLDLTSLYCRRSDGGCGSWGWWCPSYAFSETRRCSIFSCGAAPTRVCLTSFEGFPPTSHDPERCSTTPPS
jgi:hypothetical protein